MSGEAGEAVGGSGVAGERSETAPTRLSIDLTEEDSDMDRCIQWEKEWVRRILQVFPIVEHRLLGQFTSSFPASFGMTLAERMDRSEIIGREIFARMEWLRKHTRSLEQPLLYLEAMDMLRARARARFKGVVRVIVAYRRFVRDYYKPAGRGAQRVLASLDKRVLETDEKDEDSPVPKTKKVKGSLCFPK